MFETGHEEANQTIFSEHSLELENTVGVAYIADKKVAKKLSKGVKPIYEITSKHALRNY